MAITTHTRLTCLAAVSLALLSAACEGEQDGAAAGAAGAAPCPTVEPEDPPPVGQLLSHTRLLRRVKLTLLGKLPTYEEYEAITQASGDAAKDAIVEQAIDDALQSVDFYRHMVDFGRDYLGNSSYNKAGEGPYFLAGQQATLTACDPTSANPGTYGTYNQSSLCDQPGAPKTSVEPWWAPGTTVEVFDPLGSGVTEVNGQDCGYVGSSIYSLSLPDPDCSCGPNLLYCIDFDLTTYAAHNNDEEDSQRRQLWDEPARFFAHLAWHDRPLSDLVLSNYTVAPALLQAFYWKTGRQVAANQPVSDLTDFWQPSSWQGPSDPEHDVSSPVAWREVVVEQLNPSSLALAAGTSGDINRSYTFDPRTEAGEPLGIPTAGVMTMPGPLATFARERVRGARWLEIFACRNFVPPPATAEFNIYVRDPATEGVCQHCHATIDLASIHFKRWDFAGYGELTMIGGIGPWQWSPGVYGQPWERWDQAFGHDTVMTPVSQQTIETRPDARFLDFLPSDQSLYGVTSDGTIGPLGLGKILVQSGEFDACIVRKLYQRFVGRQIEPGAEKLYVDELVDHFVDDGRQLRPFIKRLLATEQFRRGL